MSRSAATNKSGAVLARQSTAAASSKPAASPATQRRSSRKSSRRSMPAMPNIAAITSGMHVAAIARVTGLDAINSPTVFACRRSQPRRSATDTLAIRKPQSSSNW